MVKNLQERPIRHARNARTLIFYFAFIALFVTLRFANAVFIIDSGESFNHADIKVSLSSENPTQIVFRASGEQATVFAREDSGWNCIGLDSLEHERYTCKFSFEPAVKIDEDLLTRLEEGITIKNMQFHNIWSDTLKEHIYTSWGYAELEQILLKLTDDKNRNDYGFWVRDAKGKTVFRCQNDDLFYPCWH